MRSQTKIAAGILLSKSVLLSRCHTAFILNPTAGFRFIFPLFFLTFPENPEKDSQGSAV
jgi:hypothetical protein